MKKIVVCILIALSLYSCSSTTSVDGNQVKTVSGFIYNKNSKYTMSYSYKGHFQEGPASKKLDFTTISLENYKNGFLDGDYDEIAMNKALENIEIFEEKYPYDREVIYSFYPSGSVKSIIPYNGKRISGVMLTFHENGMLESSTPFRNGEVHGFRRTFYSSGALKSRAEYKYGVEKYLKQFSQFY